MRSVIGLLQLPSLRSLHVSGAHEYREDLDLVLDLLNDERFTSLLYVFLDRYSPIDSQAVREAGWTVSSSGSWFAEDIDSFEQTCTRRLGNRIT